MLGNLTGMELEGGKLYGDHVYFVPAFLGAKKYRRL